MQSFRSVNYSIRPAKHAQRRMICELLSYLYPFQPIRDYQYVGFGSLWFEDFKLFHRALGIRRMVSIEKSTKRERFLENRPYKSIEILFGESNDKLQEVNWASPTVLWLDYDSTLTPSTLADIRISASKMVSGSVLAITLNVEEAAEIAESVKQGESIEQSLQLFKSRFEDHSSPNIFSDDLNGAPFRRLCRIITSSSIQKVLATRNLGSEADQKFSFELLCQFDYADGHSMATFVFIVFEEADRNKFDRCNFQSLDFLGTLGETIKIQMPFMTLKEIRHVEGQLPTDDVTQIKTQGVPGSDVKKFAAIYRYLPNFAVLE